MDLDLRTVFGFVLERLLPALRFETACIAALERNTGRHLATTSYPATPDHSSTYAHLLSSLTPSLDLTRADPTGSTAMRIAPIAVANQFAAAPLATADALQAVFLMKPGEPLPSDRSSQTWQECVVACRDALEHYRMRVDAARRGYDIEMVSVSGVFSQFEAGIRRAASSDGPVLISGPRGAGKESIAHAIHHYSGRRTGPFLAVNSAALHGDLAVSELFGYRKGAFTGAVEDRRGKFETVRGGTLFFDEVTEIPETVRPALLRALDRGEIQRLGHHAAERVDVRIVAATNKDIRRLVDEGSFPADLFDRLNVHMLTLPPLRERVEDIPVMTGYFARKFCHEFRKRRGQPHCVGCLGSGTLPSCLEAGVLPRLLAASWPGNVRELRNTILRMVTESNASGLLARHAPHVAPGDNGPADGDRGMLLRDALRRHLIAALEVSHWNKSAAARALGIPLSTLVDKMKRLSIENRSDRNGLSRSATPGVDARAQWRAREAASRARP